MPIDVICLIAFAFGFWQGYNRGIIGTVFNLLAYVFGAILAFKMAPTAAIVLGKLFNSQNPAMYVAALLLNLFVVMFIMRQAAKGVEGIFEAAYLGVFNKIAGGIMTGVFMVLAYSVVLWFLAKVQFLDQSTMAESRTYPYLEVMPGKAKGAAVRFKPLFQDFWDTSINWMDRLERYGVQQTQTKPKVYEVPDDGTGIEDAPEPLFPSDPARRRTEVLEEGSGIED